MSTSLDALLQSVQNEDLPTEDGISLLDVKIHRLLGYISDLALLSLVRLNGDSIVDHPEIITSLVRGRVVLDKIKPVESKLKYHMDKLLRAANTVNVKHGDVSDGVDVRAYRPNLDALMTSKTTNESEVTQKAQDDKPGIYKAPKIAPVHYPTTLDTDTSSRQLRDETRRLDHARKSHLVRDLINEFSDRPEEHTALGWTPSEQTNHAATKILERAKERERFEEENFVRLTVGRKERKALERAQSGRMAGNDMLSLGAMGGDLAGLRLAERQDKKSFKLSERKSRRGDDDVDMMDGGAGAGEFSKARKRVVKRKQVQSRKKNKRG